MKSHSDAIPAEAVEDPKKSRMWLWWMVSLMPVIPFVLWGLWLFATNDTGMFMVTIAALVGICAGGTIYANGAAK